MRQYIKEKVITEINTKEVGAMYRFYLGLQELEFKL